MLFAIDRADALINAFAIQKEPPIASDDSHQEYYRPSGSTEWLEIPESQELDALRNELYSAEILLGGGE